MENRFRGIIAGLVAVLGQLELAYCSIADVSASDV